jgi:PAS domain S-box-containing protein
MNTSPSVKSDIPDFLAGGGELGKLIREFDWGSTPLGPVSQWPKSLRTCIQIMLTSRQPYWIGWGGDLIKLYNDPYKAIVGGKHPWALGKPASVVWSEIWHDIEPLLTKAIVLNEGSYVESQLLIMERNGYPEETYYTFSYTPVAGDDGGIGGMICANTDDTQKILVERQLKTLSDLGKAFTEAKTNEEVYKSTISSLSRNKNDFPFTVFYELNGTTARLVSQSEMGATKFPESFGLDESIEMSPGILSALYERKPNLISAFTNYGDLPKGAWHISPQQMIVLPIAQRGQADPYGFLLIGKNPFRLFDEKYCNFFELIGDQLAISLTEVHAIEEERRRLEALAEIDRAKTTFFSNISHEFRTPLTLMLSPIESVLEDDNLTERQRHDLEISRRNTVRLQKLVNTLLDFSRIEAGKMSVHFELVDVVKLTEDLTSSFRSAIENAGIKYEVVLADKPILTAVDVNMWEKIVLNLISNAFKYTKGGSITVRISSDINKLILEVGDTGVGISDGDQSKIFDRFYRVNNSEGRSQEGTGIGLSLVRELVHLHQGEISVISKLGDGSKFTVRIPLKRRIDVEQNVSSEERKSGQRAFIEEVASWVENKSKADKADFPTENKTGRAKVLVADDNADMRDYITRLLSHDFDVTSETNGEDAYNGAAEKLPDLIVSDIMMPKLDGFGLLKKLKSNFQTRNIPVIFVSARAGEEAKVEGIQAGADDYLVKPFSARELVARVSNQIAISKTRRESEKQFFNLFLQSPAHIHVMRGPDHVFEFFHPLAKAFTGGKDFTGMSIRKALPEIDGQGYFEMLDEVYREGKSFNLKESKALLRNENGDLDEFYFNITYLPWRDADGNILGVLQFSFDVTQQAKARMVIEEAEYKLQNAVELADLGTWDIDLKTNKVTYSKQIAEWWGMSGEVAELERFLAGMHPDDREKTTQLIKDAVENTGTYEAEFRLVYPNQDQQRHILSNGKVFYDAQNNPSRMIGIARDLTLEKMAKDELERLVNLRTKELNEINDELYRSNEDLRQFAYIASHDLQEPLRKIQTFSDLTKANIDNVARASLYLDKIDHSASRMSSLIKDVLTYSQANRRETLTEMVDVNMIIENVKSDFELVIERKNAVIHADHIPAIKGNRLQIHQVFSNLISNAMKFSEKVPVITIRYSVANRSNGEDGNSIFHLITVSDNGIGFEPEYAEQIFNLFSRLHNRKDYGGTGIGLALCRKIVENHGGMIYAESEKDKGSTFKIYLPIN